MSYLPRNTHVVLAFTGNQVTKETLVDDVTGLTLSTNDYVFSGAHVVTEVCKVFGKDGVTIRGQVTRTYTYSGEHVQNVVTVRDI